MGAALSMSASIWMAFVDRASKILTEEELQQMEKEGEPEPGSEEEEA